MHRYGLISGVALSAVLAFAPPASAQQKLSDADRAWIATCVKQLEREDAPAADTKVRYCTCMHEHFDDNEPLTQSEMERSAPPMHRFCNRESGWKWSPPD